MNKNDIVGHLSILLNFVFGVINNRQKIHLDFCL